jgi:hypothetical protein
VRVLDRIIVVTGRPPELLRMDNGLELTTHAPSSLVPVLVRGLDLHRTRKHLGEPLHRVVRRNVERRAPRPRDLRDAS